MTPNGDRIRLDPCEGCGTAFPADEGKCPDCGAYRPGHRPRPAQPEPSTPFGAGRQGVGTPGSTEGLEDLFAAFGPMFGGQGRPVSKRAAWGPMARMFLGRNMGCLIWALAIFFGIPLAVGAMAGDALGGLAVMLLIVGILGLGLTTWLVWLVKPTKRR